MDDVRAVMDAAGSERAALVRRSEGGPMMRPLRRDLSRADTRAGPHTPVCRASPGPRTIRGHAAEERHDVDEEMRRTGTRRARDDRDRSAPTFVDDEGRTSWSPRACATAPARRCWRTQLRYGHGRRRPGRAARDPRADARAAPDAATRCVNRHGAAGSPSGSRRAPSSCRAATTLLYLGRLATRLSTRSRSS